MDTKKKVLTVADLHRSSELYRLLGDAVETHKPDVVAVLGDFLDSTGETDGKLTEQECAVSLSRLPCSDIVFIRGNHEDSAWWQFAEAWQHSGRELRLLEGASFVSGPLVLVGFPCMMLGNEGLVAELPTSPDAWLPKLLRSHLPASRALWLAHEPPSGTVLSERTGSVSGVREWRQAIERFSPRLVMFGHDHSTPITTKRWHCRVEGGTYCVNVGQTGSGPLHYAVVEMAFVEKGLSLPRETTVTAFPYSESFTISG